MPQNMYNLLIQDVLVNREKYANAYKSQPQLSHIQIINIILKESVIKIKNRIQDSCNKQENLGQQLHNLHYIDKSFKTRDKS